MRHFALDILACVLQGCLCALRMQREEVDQIPQLSRV